MIVKLILKDGALYTILNLLVKGIGFFLIPLYTNYFSAEDFGFIEIFTLIGFFFNSIFSLQLNQGIGRYLSDGILQETSRLQYGSTSLLAVFTLFFFFYSLVTFVLGDFILDNLLNAVVSPTFYKLGMTSIFFNSIFYFLGVYFRFLRKGNKFFIISVFYTIVNLAFTVICIVYYNSGVIGIYISYVTITPFFILIQLYFLRSKIPFYFSLKKLKQLLNYSIPFIPYGSSLIIIYFSDRLFISYFLDLEDLGIYGLGNKIGSVFSLITSSFSMAISPLIFQFYENKNLKTDLGDLFNLTFLLGVFFLALFVSLSNEIYFTLVGGDFHNLYNILPYFFLLNFMPIIGLFAQGLMINKRTKKIASISFQASIINVILNLLLIRQFGLKGALIGSCIALAFLHIQMLYFSQKEIELKINARNNIVLFFVFMIFSFGFNSFITIISTEVIVFKLLILVLIFSLFLFKDRSGIRNILSAYK